MSSRIPKATTIKTNGIWTGRKNIGAVFVRKHNLGTNLEVVKEETAGVETTKANEWLFLLEGYRKYHSVENIYLDRLVEELNIQAEDPIEPPFTAKVAQIVSLEKIMAALSVLTMDYLDFIEDQAENLEGTNLEILFDQSLNVIAKTFEVSPKALLKEFKKLKWRSEEALGKQLLTLSDKRKELIAESNLQSKSNLIGILNMHRQPNLFIMSGIEHATIFTQS